MQKIYVFILLSLGIAVHDAYPANPLFNIFNERITTTQQTSADDSDGSDDDNGDWEVEEDVDDSRAGEEATGSSISELQRAAEYLIERDHTLFSEEEDFNQFFARKNITDAAIKQTVSNSIANFKNNLIKNWNACIEQLNQNAWGILQHPNDPTHHFSRLPEYSKNKMLEEQTRRQATTPAPIPVPVPAPAPTPVQVPAPAPTPVQVPAPAPTPVQVPAPAPTPVQVPAPAPTPVQVPAPAPTPVQVPAPAPTPDGPQRSIWDRIREFQTLFETTVRPNNETQPAPQPRPTPAPAPQPEPTPAPDEISWTETENWIISQIQNGLSLAQIDADYYAAYGQLLFGPDGVLPQEIENHVTALALAEALRRRPIPSPRPAPRPVPADEPTAAQRELMAEHLANIENGDTHPQDVADEIHPTLQAEWDAGLARIRNMWAETINDHVANIANGDITVVQLGTTLEMAHRYARQLIIDALNQAGIPHGFS